MKTVYLVNGSEDGAIGVYSTFKRAYAKVKDYVEAYSKGNIDRSYQMALKDSFQIGNSGDFVKADIIKFTINQ